MIFQRWKVKKSHKIEGIKGFLIIFAWWWNSDLDPYFWLVDPDPGCPKTCESGGSGSGTLENKPWRSQRKGDIKNVFAAWPAWPTKVVIFRPKPAKNARISWISKYDNVRLCLRPSIIPLYKNTGFIRGILRGVRYAKSLRVLFLHQRSPSWTTLVLYSRVVFIFNKPTKSIAFTLKNFASFVPSFLYLKSWHR